MKNFISAWATSILANMYYINNQHNYAIIFIIIAIINFIASYYTKE